MSLLKKVVCTALSSSFILAAEKTQSDLVALAKAEAGTGLYAALGAGFVVIGAGIGIGMLAFSAANAIARQPEAAKDITGAVNLPLFLLEGVAIIGLVVCILATVA